ncbi:bifunctional diaminohydroxyphosphoribosylaminopyrimidine deaminase/5-amino-6-(5-phosphoribosylamino)uracil reductase RibD [Muriicola sp. Z0-33]|nr:bifunctional diaminohydroxyphosphoribosylaminopyrimidine deaminase/5-amino-6-(5-phosphoribosylamino)uracil reductase RibD [Muriicola sp. Z0-33]
MLRCLQLAKNGLGKAAPNPAVGCVIVHQQKIIGEGYTSPYGGPHAEVNAIASVKDKSLLSEASLFVTLEPCSHFGKTPPCADLIIKHSIANVIIGCSDPHLKVAGKGIAKLRQAGCNVTLGVLEAECRDHHKRFFRFQEDRRPYIILKWAQSSDGFMAPESSMRFDAPQPYWITNKRSRQLVHKWRSEEQAILVGTNTVLEDNPELTTRHWHGNSPIRVILDKDLKIKGDYNVLDNKVKTLIITQQIVTNDPKSTIIYEQIDFNDHLAIEIAELLFKHKIISIIIEGGARTLSTFINSGMWDEARVLTGCTNMDKGLKAPHLSGNIISEYNIMEDQVKIILND